MTKIYYIGIIRNDPEPRQELCVEKDLSSFGYFTRNALGEFMTMFGKMAAEKTKPGKREIYDEDGHKFHVYSRSEGIAGVIISDGEYPQLSAQKLLSKVVDEFLAKNPRSSWTNSNSTASLPELKEYMRTWQDPEKVDPIAMINKTLVETTNVARKNVESLIERGAKIEDLVAKSDDLSAQSKMFYRQAKKQNSCCAVM